MAANLTEEELARLAGVTRSYISKLQNYVYANPSLDVLAVLADKGYCTVGEILDSYRHEYQRLQSERFPEFPYQTWVIWYSIAKIQYHDANWHPHETLRHAVANELNLGSSQIKWAEYTGVHPAILNKYELGKTKQMPQSIRKALIDVVHVPVDIVNDLYNLVANND